MGKILVMLQGRLLLFYFILGQNWTKMNRSVTSVVENAIGLLCQLLRAIVFEAKEDSALHNVLFG